MTRLGIITRPSIPAVTIVAQTISSTEIDVTIGFGKGIPFVRFFRLEQSADGISGWAEFAQVPTQAPNYSSATFPHTNLAGSQTVFYRARAQLYFDGVTGYSPVVSATTQPATSTVTSTFAQRMLAARRHYVQYNNYDGFVNSNQWNMMSSTLAADVADPNIGGMLWYYKMSDFEASQRNYSAGESVLTQLFNKISAAETAAGRPQNSFKVILIGTLCHLTKGLGGTSKWPSGWISGTVGSSPPANCMVVNTPTDASQQAQVTLNTAVLTEIHAHHLHFAGYQIGGVALDGHPRVAAVGLDDETSLLSSSFFSQFPPIPEIPLLACYQNLLASFVNTPILVRANWFSSDQNGTNFVRGLIGNLVKGHWMFGGPDPMQRNTTMQRMFRGEVTDVTNPITDMRGAYFWCSMNQGAGWGEVGQRGNDYWLMPPGAIAAGEFGANAYARIASLIVKPEVWWAGLSAPHPTNSHNYENTTWIPSGYAIPAGAQPGTYQTDMHAYGYIWNRDDSGPPGHFVNQFSTRRFQCPSFTNSSGVLVSSPYTNGFSTNAVQCAKDVIDGMAGTTNTDTPTSLQ